MCHLCLNSLSCLTLPSCQAPAPPITRHRVIFRHSLCLCGTFLCQVHCWQTSKLCQGKISHAPCSAIHLCPLSQPRCFSFIAIWCEAYHPPPNLPMSTSSTASVFWSFVLSHYLVKVKIIWRQTQWMQGYNQSFWPRNQIPHSSLSQTRRIGSKWPHVFLGALSAIFLWAFESVQWPFANGTCHLPQ